MNFLLDLCVSNAVVATAIAIVAAASSRVVRRPALSHALWIIVLLKLLSPPLFPIPITWSWTNDALVANPHETDAASRDIDRPTSYEVGSFDETPDPSISTVAPGVPSDTASNASERLPLSIRWELLWSRTAVVAAWGAGSCVWFCLALTRLLRFHRILKLGWAADRALQERCRQIAGPAGMKQCPAVWLVPGCVSPLLWSLTSPAKLVLPYELFASLDAEQLDSLMAHELAHARRRDHWVRWLEFAVLGLYWWHPIAWWARWEIRQAEEACCDAWVVARRPGAARAYAEALLETVGFLTRARRPVPPLASGIGHVHLLKRRLTMILHPEPRHRASWQLYAGALAVGLVVLPLAPYQAPLLAQDPVLVTAPVQPVAPAAQARDGREIEQRLQALEAKLERVINALESAERPAAPESAPLPKKPGKASRDLGQGDAKAAKEAAADLQAAARKAAEAAKAQGAEAAQHARAAANKARVDAEAARQAAKGSADAADIGRQIAEAIQRSFDPERMAELGRLIGESVNKSVDPEQMAELGRQIEEAVKKSVNPKELEALGRQIELTVNKSFDPKKMKELEIEIEQAVNRAIDPEQTQALERAIEQLIQKHTDRQNVMEIELRTEKSAQGASADAAPKEKPVAKSAKARPPVAQIRKGDSADVETRMRTLEDKMDRILKALESR